jgi:hypothetical protein
VKVPVVVGVKVAENVQVPPFAGTSVPLQLSLASAKSPDSATLDT